MARANKPKKRKKNGFTLPLSLVAPLGLIGYNTALNAMNQSPTIAMDKLGYWFTGYSVQEANWKWWRLKGGLFPVFAGMLVHKMAGKIGLNKAIAQAGVPWLRI